MDVLGAQAAILTAEQLDDRLAGAAAAIPGGTRESSALRSSRPRRAVYLPDGDFENCSHYRRRGVSRGLRRRAAASNGHKSVVAAFYPVAYAAERIGGGAYDVENLTPAESSRTTSSCRRATVGRIESADVVLYLGHGFQPAVSTAAGAAHGTRVDILAGMPLHGLRSARLARSCPVSRASSARSAAALHRPATGVARAARPARSRIPRRPAQLPPARDRHQPRGVRLSRPPLSAAAGGDHRAHTRVGAVATATRRRRPSSREDACDDGLLRAARLAAAGTRRSRGRSARARPCSTRSRASRSPGETYFSLMRQNLAALRKALACR